VWNPDDALYGPRVIPQPSLATAHYADAGPDPDLAKQREKDKAGAEDLDLVGKGLGLLGIDTKGALALPADGMKTEDSVREIANGDYKNGIPDTASNGASLVADLAEMAGFDGVKKTADAIHAGSLIGKGGGELYEGIKNGETSEAVDGVDKLLNGAADGSAALPGNAGKVGKAAQFGLAVGNKLAPSVFGAKDEPCDVQQSDGTYVPSTGNGAVDWVFGVGKYEKSRFEADGHTAHEMDNETAGETAHSAMDAGMAKVNAEARIKEAEASPEEAARIHANRKALFENGMGPDPDA